MFFESLSRLLQDYCYNLLFLLSIAVLGFSAGVCAPLKYKQSVEPTGREDPSAGRAEAHDERIAERAKSEAEGSGDGVKYISGKHLGRSGVLKEEQLIINTSKAKVDEKREMDTSKKAKVDEKREMDTRKGKVDTENREEREVMPNMKLECSNSGFKKIKEGKAMKERDSNPRPIWLRSLSLGQRREQDSNPGRQRLVLHESKVEEKGVQRKKSLTGEEVKELADAFIARVRQRMRVQRQESYELRQEDLAKQAYYKACLDRSS